jgi:hypothetical protein
MSKGIISFRKRATAHQGRPIWRRYDRGGGGVCYTAVLQYADRIGYAYSATNFGKPGFHTLQTEYLKKILPKISPFFYISISKYRPFRIWSEIRRKLFATEENAIKRRKKFVFHH